MTFRSLILVFVLAASLTACSSSNNPDETNERIAVLYVGHGEPAVFERGDEAISFPDGSEFGPHGADIGVPVEYQHTEWAAAYEEIATAMTYIFGDINGNGTKHEMAISPAGDVPPFFTWPAFHADIQQRYAAFENYSPHNDALIAHVESLDLKVDGFEIDTYLAFLDAIPRIPDAVWELTHKHEYTKLVMVPMLLANSTHTQEIEDQIREIAALIGDMEVVVTEPFFEVPYMRERFGDAVLAMALDMYESVPEATPDEEVGVLLASHGSPYVPPHSEFGWEEGDIFSNLVPTEDAFHDELSSRLRWRTHTGRMNYSTPTIEESLAAMEAEGIRHLLVTPTAFPTAAMHTQWDVASSVIGRAALPEEGIIVHTRESGMKVYYTAQGFADLDIGREHFRDGLRFLGQVGMMEVIAQAANSENLPDVVGGGDGSGGDGGGTGGTGGGGDGDGDGGTGGGGDGGGDGGGGGGDTFDPTCMTGEICVTVTAGDVTGEELTLMLYIATEENWPQDFRSLPTPSWVVQENPIPDSYPLHIRIPLADNLFAFSNDAIDGARLGLAIVTGVSSNFVVDPTDARGFSDTTLVYDAEQPLHFGGLELSLPAGETCELNPYHPSCLSGGLFWKEHFLGEQDFVPGAVYMADADVDGDGIDDIITVGEPHFEVPELPLTALKMGVYYLNTDHTVREMEIIDSWSDADPALYSPWGVRVIDHAGAPMIIVGTNIPGLAPLEEGTGNVYSYRRVNGNWVRSDLRINPQPDVESYNAMIVVTCDIDQDGDEDLVLSGAFTTSSLGSWMENTGLVNDPWIPHLLPAAADTPPYIRGTLAYKCGDVNDDGYPDVMYNGMFDVPDTTPPRYRGEIWLAVNPGPSGWTENWQRIVIDDDNWASADMWLHDFNDDNYPDLIANQIFDSTVTRYMNPGGDVSATWPQEVIVSGLTSPSDMWLDDMDQDGLVDVISADHTAHRGVWHKNPGYGADTLWEGNLIFRNIRLPGDFAMNDLDDDGDLDWLGVSMTRGQAYIVEQVEPITSLVATVSLPDTFDGNVAKLMFTLATELPVTGSPAAILASIDNVDTDGDGLLDVDQLLGVDKDFVFTMEDVGVSSSYHVIATLYVEGGGQFQPVPGVDYMAASELLALGAGQVSIDLELAPVPGGP
jgi:protoheme ferro-lyase